MTVKEGWWSMVEGSDTEGGREDREGGGVKEGVLGESEVSVAFPGEDRSFSDEG